MSDIIEELEQKVEIKSDSREQMAKPKAKHVPSYHKEAHDHSDAHSAVEFESNDNHELDSVSHTINAMSLGPGNVLKSSREEAKLSKEDVAKELRVTLKHIEYLEHDAYYKFPAVAFYVGYLRNYSKLLNLDPDKIIAKFHAVYKAVPESPMYKKAANLNSPTLVKSLNEIWPFNFLLTKDKTKSQQVNTHGIKYFLMASGAVVVALMVWLLSSTLGYKTNETLTTAEILKLEPHVVDEVLPTSPVIVQNTIEPAELTESVPVMLSQNTQNGQNTLDEKTQLNEIS